MKTLYDFRIYVEREKNKRRGAFFFNFAPDEGLLFQEEIACLREIVGRGSYPYAALTKEVTFPHELSDEQIYCYFSLIPGFIDGEVEKRDVHYAKLYLLEIANLLHHSDPSEALKSMFRFRDELHLSADIREFFSRLCDSFLVAWPDTAMEMKIYQRARGLLPYRDPWEEIRNGIFDGAAMYVKNNARLLKENDLSGEKPFQVHAWNAMPDVFYELDDLGRTGRGRYDVSFRQLVTAGKEERMYLDLLPVKGIQAQRKDRIPIGDDLVYLKEKGYGRADRWFRQKWNLYDSSGDFLYLVYLYTESYMREYLRGPKRARSAARILKKNYRRNDDLPRNIRGMKAMIQDEEFTLAIDRGVKSYLGAHPEIREDMEAAQAEKKRSQSRKRSEDSRRRREEAREQQKKQIYEMDHEQLSKDKIDKERLAQAKKEMDHLSGMLHEGNLDYD